MYRLEWSALTSNSEAHRRAGGRRRYNSWRKLKAAYRLRQVAEMYLAGVTNKAEIARKLNVSRSTICRDFQRYEPLRVLDITRRLDRQLGDPNYRRQYVFQAKRGRRG